MSLREKFESVTAAVDPEAVEPHIRSSLRLGEHTLCGVEVGHVLDVADERLMVQHCAECVQAVGHYRVIAGEAP